jgi:hypothetical protein
MNYQALRATAGAAIKTSGGIFNMRTKTSVTSDPIEGTVTSGEVLTQDVNAVILNASSKSSGLVANDKFSDIQAGSDGGTLARHSIRKVLMSMEGVEWIPKDLDEMFYDNEWWSFRQPLSLSPDGDTIVILTGVIVRV